MRIILFFLLVTLSSTAYSQSLEGTWVIKKIERTLDNGVVIIDYDRNQLANLIDVDNIIVNHLPNGVLTGTNVYGENLSTGTWEVINNQIIYNGNGTTLEVISQDEFATVMPYNIVNTLGEPVNSSVRKIYIRESLLPIKLLLFEVKNDSYKATLVWKSETEEDFSHFEVERSIDAKEFQKIGRVNAKGNNSSYEYADEAVSPIQAKTVYYRLKMVDLDGSFKYSEIRSIRLDENQEIAIYPNPVNNETFQIELNGNEADNFIVKDLSGRTIKSGSISNTEIDVSELSQGVYLITFLSQEVPVNTVKLVKN